MILAALFTRPVQKKPVRFLATVLGIAAGVAAVVSTLSASGAALSSLREGVGRLAGSAAVEVTCAGGVDESELTRLAPLALDAVLLPVVERVATCTTLGDTVRVFGVDLLSDPRFTASAHTIARIPDAVDVFTVPSALVSDEIARDAHVAPGGTITLQIASQAVDLRVAGTFSSEGASVLGRLVVVDVALAQELFGEDGRLSRIEILPRGDVRRSDLSARARALVSKGMEVGTPEDRAANTNALVRSLEFNLGTMSGISLLVGGVLVATTLATSVVQRRRTIALLYALGASRGQVLRSLMSEAVILGVLGGVGGVALGYAGARFMVDGLRATLSTVVSTTAPSSIPLSSAHVAIGLGLGMCVSLCAAVLPVLEGARTPPIQSLRAETPTFLTRRARLLAGATAVGFALIALLLIRLPAWNNLPVFAILGSLCLLAALFAIFGPAVDLIGRTAGAATRWPATLRLACVGLSAGRRRAAWAAGAVGVAVALSIAIATMVGSFRSTVVDWVAKSINADFAIRPERGQGGVPIGLLDRRVVDIAREIPGVGETFAYYTSTATWRDRRIGLAGISFEATRKRGWCALLGGMDSRAVLDRAFREGLVLVSEAGAYHHGWKVDEEIVFEVRGNILKRRVAGIYTDHSDSVGTVVLDEPVYLALFPHANPNFVDVNCRTPEDIEPVRSALNAALLGRYQVEINDNPRMRESILSVFDKTFEVTRALQGVSALVAILAVLSVLFALVHERRADIALLSALGAGGGQVLGLVAVQALILGTLGAVCGSACGLLIGFVLTTVVNLQSFGWSLTFVAPWSAIVTMVIVVGVSCGLAGLLPARAAASRTMREALREE